MAGSPLTLPDGGTSRLARVGRARLALAGPARAALSRLARLLPHPLAVLGLSIVVLLVLVGTFADALAPYDPVVGGDLRTTRLLPPSAAYWFGTDDQARDILSRLIHGARIALGIVALVAAIATPVGLLVGTVAGYLGGFVDAVLMRITDIFLAFPRLILALAFVAALGPGIEERRHCDLDHDLAALRPSRPRRDADHPQFRTSSPR